MTRRSERGQTAVEFALVIPVMLLFILGIFQIGVTYFNNEALQTSARDGARAGAIHTGATVAQIQAYVENAVKANAVGLDASKIQFVPAPSCDGTGQCNQNETLTVTVTYPWSIGVMAFSKSGTLTTVTKLRME